MNTFSSRTPLVFACAIIALWGVSLTLSFSLRFEGTAYLLAVPLGLVVAFLTTGLFITAHDAMHGLVAPGNRTLNNLIGRISTFCYALFSFDSLREKHREHHRHPATGNDPDFHDGTQSGFWRWYLRFLLTYMTWRQLLGMALAYNAFKYLLGVPDVNLITLWVAPSLLSTLQLFTFGTYLPHRETSTGYPDEHRARSNQFPAFLSFLSCYHFGYHWEHHAYPHIPWWALPAARAANSPRVAS